MPPKTLSKGFVLASFAPGAAINSGLAIRMTTKAASNPPMYRARKIQPRSQPMRPAKANSTAPQLAAQHDGHDTLQRGTIGRVTIGFRHGSHWTGGARISSAFKYPSLTRHFSNLIFSSKSASAARE